MKRNRALGVLMLAWLAASAACQGELVDGPPGTGGTGAAGGSGGSGAANTGGGAPNGAGGTGAGGDGGGTPACVLDQSQLDGCVLQ